jgi:hypothetical protein
MVERSAHIVCATITLALGTHPVRGKGRSPPDLQLSFVNLLSAQCADNGHEMKGGPCDRFHRTSIPSGPTQSPTSEGPSQEFVENGKCEITDRGTVPDRASLRICELAQAQGSRRFARGERAAQASHRHQRPRHSQNSHDSQTCVAPLSAWDYPRVDRAGKRSNQAPTNSMNRFEVSERLEAGRPECLRPQLGHTA